MLTLLATLLVAAPIPGSNPVVPRVSRAPAIQVTLNNGGTFVPGGMVNVRVQTTDDGYLIVFRVDGDGRVRVVFPLDPDGDAFVRGGKEYELRGRGDRATFLADDRGGSGMVYAAIATAPLVLRDFTVNGHWDYDALRLRDSSTDAENDLTAIVSRMTNHARFDYDAVGYRVEDIAANVGAVAYTGGGYYPGLYDPYYNPRWRCMSCGWGYPGSDLTVGFGYSPFWDPYLYSPWGYNYSSGYGYGFGFGGFPGSFGFPVVNHPRPPLPVGTRPRPRPMTPPPGSSHVNAPPPPARSAPSGASGTRSRPRPADMTAIAPRRPEPDQRTVFRQPQQGQGLSSGVRAEPRPAYREPPQVYRAPPQVYRAPPPSASSAPRSAPSQQHSAPPPPAARSRPSGGGHR
jgi:YD repeat-containing protein